jgi:dGTPase
MPLERFPSPFLPLSIMDWQNLLNSKRLGEKTPSIGATDVRSEYDRDADRVLFSGPFRRLSRKTQVHPLVANDHVHNRLTHSLETGQVGRSLAKHIFERIKADLPSHILASDLGSIVQAACLTHDIGNPPFGHAGEEAMGHWFETNAALFKHLPTQEQYDLSRFDGNAQGFRILTQTENFVFDGGMRLTFATLATFLKYPRTSAGGQPKFSVFNSEANILERVASEVGLSKKDGVYARHPLAYLVEAADDICYCVLDIEDAVELRIVTFEEALAVFEPLFDAHDRERLASERKGNNMFRVNFSRMRGPVFRTLIEGASEAFSQHYPKILEGDGPKDLFSALPTGDPRRSFIDNSKALGRSRIYRDSKKVEVELGAFATLDILLSELCAAAKKCAADKDLSEGTLDWKSRLVIGLLGDHAPRKDNTPGPDGWSEYLTHRRAVDFVSGMTDNYATYLAKQISGNAFTGLQRP